MVRVIRIVVLTTTETVKIRDKTIAVLTKAVNLVTISKVRTNDRQGVKPAISRMTRKENVPTINEMREKAKMTRTITLQMAKGVTKEIAVTENDPTGASEFARKKALLKHYRKSPIKLSPLKNLRCL